MQQKTAASAVSAKASAAMPEHAAMLIAGWCRFFVLCLHRISARIDSKGRDTTRGRSNMPPRQKKRPLVRSLRKLLWILHP